MPMRNRSLWDTYKARYHNDAYGTNKLCNGGVVPRNTNFTKKVVSEAQLKAKNEELTNQLKVKLAEEEQHKVERAKEEQRKATWFPCANQELQEAIILPDKFLQFSIGKRL
ncbi:hypothetical protein E2562_006401 [Oryza meyeriana var. granulata]|uniref:Uncharacterized protein n=1 Tax=Oryza meyeriana var. granulata TaxID=110450 RepID=A0A6G1EFJ3_9ORYZ|nr:hypothetical protein E2562_006401 [Oryza meyeriana var. granulata]